MCTEMNQVIYHLKKELKTIKFERKLECELQTSQAKTLQEHICDICSYNASSAIVLKSYTSRKHKKEVLRGSDANMQLSVTNESRNRI